LFSRGLLHPSTASPSAPRLRLTTERVADSKESIALGLAVDGITRASQSFVDVLLKHVSAVNEVGRRRPDALDVVVET
jgi:hypothetical protein